MRIIALVIFVLIQVGFAFSQDGGNINYVKLENLDKSYIGRLLHIDFYRKSRGNLGQIKNGVDIDQVFLDINNKKIKFTEHRKDDGYNNWFDQQYLKSVNSVNGTKIIITNFKLIDIEEENIIVLANFNIKPFSQEMRIDKNIIAELLFKVDK